MSSFFFKSSVVLLTVLAVGGAPMAATKAKYDVITSTRAMAAQDSLNNMELDAVNINRNYGASVDMYTPEQMDNMIENKTLVPVVLHQDRCQFVPDIEDRARLVGLPIFQFAWGEMLVSGICVKKDENLGVEYIKKAADNSYAPAMERMSFYYEKGYYVNRDLSKSERYMHTAAALGSKSGRLGWADMLVRGYGSPQLYEEAFSWLYHSSYEDAYSREKKNFLQGELEKRMPPNIVARDMQFNFDL